MARPRLRRRLDAKTPALLPRETNGMMAAMGDPARKMEPATLEDLRATLDDEHGYEIIDGELVRREMTSWAHGRGLSRLNIRIGDPFDRPPDRGGPGGWWIMVDVTIELAPTQIYRPDLLGFRRERVPTPPTGFPVRLRPDWVCEILSPSNARNDKVKKLRNYHRFEIPHYWILDPMDESLLVFRWTEPGFTLVQTATRGERIHAEPFGAVELDLDDILGEPPPRRDARAPLTGRS